MSRWAVRTVHGLVPPDQPDSPAGSGRGQLAGTDGLRTPRTPGLTGPGLERCGNGGIMAEASGGGDKFVLSSPFHGEGDPRSGGERGLQAGIRARSCPRHPYFSRPDGPRKRAAEPGPTDVHIRRGVSRGSRIALRASGKNGGGENDNDCPAFVIPAGYPAQAGCRAGTHTRRCRPEAGSISATAGRTPRLWVPDLRPAQGRACVRDDRPQIRPMLSHHPME